MEFIHFPKISRMTANGVITEKIDGTNACVIVEEIDPILYGSQEYKGRCCKVIEYRSKFYGIGAQSRTRLIVPGNDNFGFAAWVKDNAEELIKLGPGHHFGEWWGKGIQRGYGLDEKRFSLFNVGRYHKDVIPSCCRVVPILYSGPLTQKAIDWTLIMLNNLGSLASPRFMGPEGIIIYHSGTKTYYKQLLENDDKPKSEIFTPQYGIETT